MNKTCPQEKNWSKQTCPPSKSHFCFLGNENLFRKRKQKEKDRKQKLRTKTHFLMRKKKVKTVT